LRFLGWYISEGHIQEGKAVCVTQCDEEETESIVLCMQDIGLNVAVYREKREGVKTINRIRGYNASLARWLTENAGRGAANKRVPRFVMELSKRQIGLFLDTLFAGDGTKKEGVRWYQYTSVSEQLKDDVQELILKAGLAATIHRGRTVGILTKQNMPTINTRPKPIDYDDLVWCVRVPNGLIYARRNGKPIWTGNSYRLQKGLEQMAYQALQDAILTGNNPKVRIVATGHLHVSMSMWRGPILGLQVGCFEGVTNYLRRKALVPQVGGYVIKMDLTEAGVIARCSEEWIAFNDIENDFLNYPEITDRLAGYGRADVPAPLFEWRVDDGKQ